MHNIFPVEHHHSMLSDTHRIHSFYSAIKETIGPLDNIADIGTGTGILAAYAAHVTKGKVYGIEYFEKTFKMAAYLKEKIDLPNLNFIHSSSYNKPIAEIFNGVISETIGSIGPEENIVELCFEFKKRYPEVNYFIPYELDICLEPIFDENLENHKKSVLNSFLKIPSFENLFLDKISNLSENLGTNLYAGDLSKARSCGEEISLKKYKLGIDFKSDFKSEITFNTNKEISAAHLFLEQNCLKISIYQAIERTQKLIGSTAMY